MNRQAKIIVGVLVTAVVGIGITVGVMAAGDDHPTNNSTSAHMGGSDIGYQGMMGAMGNMDRDDMLRHMRDVLGEDAYQRMLGHMADHQSGMPMSGNAAIDQMMHTMMDGMMGQMPMGSSTVLPPGSDQHHDTPVLSSTPAP